MGWSEAIFIIESLKKEIEKLQVAISRIEATLAEKNTQEKNSSN